MNYFANSSPGSREEEYAQRVNQSLGSNCRRNAG